MLVRSYKEKRVLAKETDELGRKLDRILAIVNEPLKLTQMPGVPSAEDLKRMVDPNEEDHK